MVGDRFTQIDKVLELQSKINNNMVKLIKKLDKRIDKLEKDNEIDLENIKVGGND